MHFRPNASCCLQKGSFVWRLGCFSKKLTTLTLWCLFNLRASCCCRSLTHFGFVSAVTMLDWQIVKEMFVIPLAVFLIGLETLTLSRSVNNHHSSLVLPQYRVLKGTGDPSAICCFEPTTVRAHPAALHLRAHCVCFCLYVSSLQHSQQILCTRLVRDTFSA